jgi:hypothetical protein
MQNFFILNLSHTIIAITVHQGNETIHAFGQAICSGDIHIAGGLLCNSGRYEIQNRELDIVAAAKEQFISWLALRRLEYPNGNALTYSITNCNVCDQRQNVLVFDQGRFPFMAWMKHRVSFAGLSLYVENDKITASHICLGFCGKENPSFMERFNDEAVKLNEENGIDPVFGLLNIFEREYGRKLEIKG